MEAGGGGGALRSSAIRSFGVGVARTEASDEKPAAMSASASDAAESVGLSVDADGASCAPHLAYRSWSRYRGGLGLLGRQRQ